MPHWPPACYAAGMKWAAWLAALLLTPMISLAASSVPNPFTDFWTFLFENRLFLYQSPNEQGYVLRIRPILPARLNKKWTLISVPIFRIGTLPKKEPNGYVDRFAGFGDLDYGALLTTNDENRLKLALGPWVTAPTGSNPTLSLGRWLAGPALGAAYFDSDWLASVLFVQEWPISGAVSGAEKPATSLFTAYSMFTRNLSDGWQIGTTPELFVFWDAPSGKKVLFPAGLGAGKTFVRGGELLNIFLEAKYYWVRPEAYSATWLIELRFRFGFQRPGSSIPVTKGAPGEP